MTDSNSSSNISSKTNTPIRVRFAPSPTGSLHLGGARTALYNYLFAKNQGGEFILRCEDTDLERSSEESLRTQLADLAWLGLNWDEGIDAITLEDKGDHAPYRQSKRTANYIKHAEQLISKGQAYYCFLTDEDVLKQKEQAKEKGSVYQITSPYRYLSLSEAKAKIAAGEKATVRFKIPEQDVNYTFTDLVRGEVTLPSHMVGDFVLMRTNGMPVYNFCCVIDDAAMEITHVLRGEEHLSNTLRQLMLYEVFNYKKPEFGHLSMILGENKKKLSKRDAAVSCDDFKQQGFLPQAVLNYVALLGWSSKSGEEVFSFDNLIKDFSVERVNAAAAVFDIKKMRWINQHHIRMLSKKDLWEKLQPFFKQANLDLNTDPKWQDKSLELFTQNLEVLSDAIELYKPLADNIFDIKPESHEVLEWEATKPVIKSWIEQVEAINTDYLSADEFNEILNNIKTQCDVKGKNLFMPIRVAIIGAPHGAELKSLVPLLKKEVLLARANTCI